MNICELIMCMLSSMEAGILGMGSRQVNGIQLSRNDDLKLTVLALCLKDSRNEELLVNSEVLFQTL